MPRVAHYVWGLRTQPEPFHLVHELAIRSCLEMVQPDEVHLHCGDEPTGPHWDAIAERVTLHPVERVPLVTKLRYPDAQVRRYAHAHHADFVRLDVLAERGGLYADLDTLFLAPVPEWWWLQPFVIGREADVADPMGGAPKPAISNAIMLSAPGSPFVEAWRAEIGDALDGSWANHSCFLAHDLAARMPDAVHVEPQRTFHAFEPSPEGIALMLEHPPPNLDDIVAMHLAAHLWWDDDRVDFSTVHAGEITEGWIRTSPATYAVAARRFLA